MIGLSQKKALQYFLLRVRIKDLQGITPDERRIVRILGVGREAGQQLRGWRFLAEFSVATTLPKNAMARIYYQYSCKT